MDETTTFEGEAAVQNGVKRMIFAVVAIVLEIAFLVFVYLYFAEHAEWFAIGTRILGTLLVLVIYNGNKPSAMKMTWIIVIMALPVFGIVFYLLTSSNVHLSKMKKSYKKVDDELFPLLPNDDDEIARLARQDQRAANIARYVSDVSHYPLYDNTLITYYDDAATGLEAQKEDLRQAKDFIFMEYHAIQDAESWHGIQDILVDRVKAGVEVRVFYDDMGSISFVNTDFVERLEALGIKARVFNPFVPLLNLFLNNRDHRKITVIDGRVGYTGGYNLANEYFHITEPFGYWKDTGVRLEGEAVKNLTVAFLEMWNAINDKDVDDVDYRRYLPDVPTPPFVQGYVMPYADSPLDDEAVGEDVYISIAEYAKSYAWFVTPYLIITDEMNRAFGMAAKRGVDVRIITPGIPDKKLVYSITQSHYQGLVRNGVRIFEYTPGFCHAKMSITDDILAACGTINLDYRSLYHHFENGCLYYDCDAVGATKRDFEAMFAESKEVTKDYSKPGAGMRLRMLIMRLAAPLL